MFPLTNLSMLHRNNRMEDLAGTTNPIVVTLLDYAVIIIIGTKHHELYKTWTGTRQDNGQSVSLAQDDPNWFI